MLGRSRSRPCGFYKVPSMLPMRKPSKKPVPACFSRDCHGKKRSAAELTHWSGSTSEICLIPWASPMGRGGDITINNRDYETTDSGSQYRVPDARLGDVAFDWTLSLKTIGSAQIRGFFRADSQPRAVIIIRPSALGSVRTYLLPRPDD